MDDQDSPASDSLWLRKRELECTAFSVADAGDLFHDQFGDPSPPSADGLPPKTARVFWDGIKTKTGAGWFSDGLFYLGGTGLERLHQCLDAWSFIVPPTVGPRIILGFNIYGAILVYEPDVDLVKVVDPLVVAYWTDPNLDFIGFFGHFMPQRRIPRFFDRTVFDAWRKTHPGEALVDHEILGIGVPLSLEGDSSLSNFAKQDIVAYYQTAALDYQDALEHKQP